MKRSLFNQTTFCVVAALLLAVASTPLMGQPANDNFASRALIPFSDGTTSGTLAGATSEPGEPFLPEISSGQTAWWTWTAPSNGVLTVAASATNFYPLITVFQGDALSDLSLLASNNYLICYSDGDCGCHWRARNQTSFQVHHGQSYQIAVDSLLYTDASMEWATNVAVPENPGCSQQPWIEPEFDTNGALIETPQPVFGVVFATNFISGGDVQLALSFLPAPPNDDFANAMVLSGSRLRAAANNTGATKEPGEPDVTNNPGGSSIWFSWKAPASGRLTLSTNEFAPYAPPSWYGLYEFTDGGYEWGGDYGVTDIELINYGWWNLSYCQAPTCGDAIDQTRPPPPFFPLLGAYTGSSVESLRPVNFQPVNQDAYPYAIEFDVTKGRNYNLVYDGNMGTTNAITLFLALTRPAVNAAFAHRIRVQGNYIVVSGFNAGAAPQPGAPDIGNGCTGELAWWTWTAPVTGLFTNDLTGSDYSFPLAVFTGNNLASLTQVASGVGGLTFNSVMGKTYQIAVGDAGGLTGEIKMNISGPLIPMKLLGVLKFPGTHRAMLRFGARSGQVLQLQRRGPNNWIALQSAMARNNEVNFLINNPPADVASYYRAVVVNYISH